MKRNTSLDFIRAFATFLIVTFHFAYFGNQTDSILFGYANGGWGSVGTTLFFLLSGYVLYVKYPVISNITTFYKKRFLAIFPMFYIAFGFAYLLHSMNGYGFTYGGSPLRFVFTLLGIDSYLGFYSINSYHLVAEWFTAIIIILYLLYPLLCKLFAKKRTLTTAAILLLYLLNLQFDFFIVPDDANLITGLFCFWIGMLLGRTFSQNVSTKEENVSCLIRFRKWIPVFSLALALLIIFVKLPWQSLLWKNLLGISLFLMLHETAGFFLRIPGISFCSNKLSKYSYAIYLIHHFIINDFYPLIKSYMPTRHTTLFLYFALIYLICICAYSIYQINAALFATLSHRNKI